jgi:hypothetical protein
MGSVPSPLVTYPPLDFSLVGMSHWRGPKWAASFEGFPTSGARSVYLAHAVDEAGLIVVKSAHRQRWDAEHGGGTLADNANSDRLRAKTVATFAWVLLLFLVDSARPELQGQDRSDYETGMVPFVTGHADKWSYWETAEWTFGKRSITARVFRFADSWTGFSIDDPDRYIAVASYHMAGTDLHLDEIHATSYGFDFSVPFRIDQLQELTADRPDLKSAMGGGILHSDHKAVMAASPWSIRRTK